MIEGQELSEGLGRSVTRRRVEFGETDMAGIAHFSNFFRYMEVAETDFFHARGVSLHWVENGRRFGLPRVSAACDYRKPARFGDVFEITCVLERVGTKSLTFRHEFRLGGELAALGRVTAVLVTGDEAGMNAVEIPGALRAKLLGERGASAP